MYASGSTAVVTGAAGGIGRAHRTRLAAEGLRLVLADLDADAPRRSRRARRHAAVAGDCASERGHAPRRDRDRRAGPGRRLLRERRHRRRPGPRQPGRRLGPPLVDVNVMAHVRAARALVPRLARARRRPPRAVTASAAGLLTMIGTAPYSVTKHAAVGLRRVALDHLRRPRHHRPGDLPAGRADPDARGVRPAAGAALPRRGARPPRRSPTRGSRPLDDDRFLVLPHPEVAGYYAAPARTPTAGWPACAASRPNSTERHRMSDGSTDPRGSTSAAFAPGTTRSAPGESRGDLQRRG